MEKKRKRGRPSKADLALAKREAEKTLIARIATVIGFLLIIGIAVENIRADTITHKFKSPSFSGVGTSSHYLTIENQEKSRKDKIRADIEAALKSAERADQNSKINKFIRNLESRIYSQISKG